MNWLLTAFGLVVSALAGAAAVAKVRPERRKLNADAALTLQQATAEGIDNIRQAARESVRQARADARRAHEEALEARQEAEDARQRAEAAQAELRQLRAELLQARVEMADLRASAAAERAEAAVRHESATATIRELSLELQMARLGHGPNGARGEYGG